ncbi:MAG: phospho-N-acetylmuramoyl-pentapeptide-transferase, partial [Patescibacteria group bacterium]
NSPWYTKLKLGMVTLCGLVVGWWFFSKLGMDSIHIPFDGYLYLGFLFIPAVILVMLGTFSGGVIDGIDGLAGGVVSAIFAAYSVVAFMGNYLDIAALCGVIAGAVLAFLWFNIPPARFYMGEVGMMPLTITLAAVAFLTDTVLILPIIAFPLVVTSLSSSIQLLSKKFFGRRVFKVAPIHHHFEALGWPSHKVTMRFWVLAVIFSIIGIIISAIS